MTLKPASNHPGVSEEGVDHSIQQIEHGTRSLKERDDRCKQQLRTALKQISDLKLENTEGSRELQEAKMRIEQLEAVKKKAKSRLGGYNGHFKQALRTSDQLLGDLKKAKNQIAYLETLLVFEEKSGFSTLVSETQLQ